MSKGYVVTAAMVQAHCVDDKDRHFYQDQPIPAGVVKPDHLKQLVEMGMVAEADLADATSDDAGEWTGPKGVKVDDVLAYVGDDPDRAADVLEQEEAADNRKTLVDKLEKIIDPAAD